jgi:hypothetical protein
MGISFNSLPSRPQRIFHRGDAETLGRRKVQSHYFYPEIITEPLGIICQGLTKKKLSETSAPSLRLRASAVEIFRP